MRIGQNNAQKSPLANSFLAKYLFGPIPYWTNDTKDIISVLAQ